MKTTSDYFTVILLHPNLANDGEMTQSLLMCVGSKKKLLPDVAVQAMSRWTKEHLDNPFPSKEIKLQFERLHEDMSMSRVNWWFTNARRPGRSVERWREEAAAAAALDAAAEPPEGAPSPIHEAQETAQERPGSPPETAAQASNERRHQSPGLDSSLEGEVPREEELMKTSLGRLYLATKRCYNLSNYQLKEHSSHSFFLLLALVRSSRLCAFCLKVCTPLRNLIERYITNHLKKHYLNTYYPTRVFNVLIFRQSKVLTLVDFQELLDKERGLVERRHPGRRREGDGGSDF
ncbi:hypothetical protein CAPTEDRAFT_219543 [Capitella teleta]|uniref:KN homeodomain domain-containing protein n=1 Tax=Capitella teleta TaxID=283909 RepID=R7VEN5_CAPTE|nr:hypothetical protein CAPTEDRAFT_219543 [Capitella teleta]|eukprot:ELU17298.1 hypothetical protein CAPTEDRAFT_219543 [Capitella teleta]